VVAKSLERRPALHSHPAVFYCSKMANLVVFLGEIQPTCSICEVVRAVKQSIDFVLPDNLSFLCASVAQLVRARH
jgi:hypothetical protein